MSENITPEQMLALQAVIQKKLRPLGIFITYSHCGFPLVCLSGPWNQRFQDLITTCKKLDIDIDVIDDKHFQIYSNNIEAVTGLLNITKI